MMKAILACLMFLCLTYICKAQWTVSGNNAITTVFGNVGIGNSNPSDKLVVTGPVRTNVGGNGIYGSGGGFVAYDQDNGGNHLFSLTRQVNNLSISSFDGVGFAVGTNAASTNYRVFISSNGYFGVGTTTPGAPLSVVNSAPIFRLWDNEVNPADGSSIGKISFGSNSEFASIEALRNPGSYDDVTYIKFTTSAAPGAGGDGVNLERMRITPEGALAIGTTDAKGYKLAVNGSMIATSIKVKSFGSWPDYVFKRQYYLRPLSQVKSYIDKNSHLPEIPSANEIEKNGMDVAEMNRLLLKKVEELTLYLIEKDAEIKAQQKQINQILKTNLKRK